MVDSRVDFGLGDGFVGTCGVECYIGSRKSGYFRRQVICFGLERTGKTRKKDRDD